MSPITFSCRDTLPFPPEEFARQILDLARWTSFRGYWPIPGIRHAEFEGHAPADPEHVVGTRVRVTNLDGSTHVEEIVEWRPESRIRLRMSEFSPPLSHLAAWFEETWELERVAGGTRALRTFQIQPTSAWTWLPVWLMSKFLKSAIVRHLRDVRRGR